MLTVFFFSFSFRFLILDFNFHFRCAFQRGPSLVVSFNFQVDDVLNLYCDAVLLLLLFRFGFPFTRCTMKSFAKILKLDWSICTKVHSMQFYHAINDDKNIFVPKFIFHLCEIFFFSLSLSLLLDVACLLLPFTLIFN